MAPAPDRRVVCRAPLPAAFLHLPDHAGVVVPVRRQECRKLEVEGTAARAVPAAQEQPVSFSLLVYHVPAPRPVASHAGPAAWAERSLFAVYDEQIPGDVVLDGIMAREDHEPVPSAAALLYAVVRRSTAGRPPVVCRLFSGRPAIVRRSTHKRRQRINLYGIAGAGC